MANNLPTYNFRFRKKKNPEILYVKNNSHTVLKFFFVFSPRTVYLFIIIKEKTKIKELTLFTTFNENEKETEPIQCFIKGIFVQKTSCGYSMKDKLMFAKL